MTACVTPLCCAPDIVALHSARCRSSPFRFRSRAVPAPYRSRSALATLVRLLATPPPRPAGALQRHCRLGPSRGEGPLGLCETVVSYWKSFPDSSCPFLCVYELVRLLWLSFCSSLIWILVSEPGNFKLACCLKYMIIVFLIFLFGTQLGA